MARALCPICKQPRSDEHRPFCSKRCADVDLLRWFSGAYAIPSQEDDDGAGVFRAGDGDGDSDDG